MAEDRIGKLGRGRELLELPAEMRAEELVDNGEHLGTRAVVERQGQRLLGGLAPLAEDLDVGVPESVDRLELVADEEELRLRRPEQVDDLGLEAVRVLELVDEDRAEARLLALAQLRLRAEQIARLELQVLEVERGLVRLRLGVPLGEQRQQFLQECAVAGGCLVQRSLLDGREGVAIRGGAIAARLEAAEAHQPVGSQVAVQELEQLRGVPLLTLSCFRVPGERARRRAQLVDAFAELRLSSYREVELAPSRTQRLVDARQHPTQPVAPVSGEELEPLRVVAGAELGERLAERLGAEHRRLRFVELPKPWVEPGSERIGPEESGTEAVDR